MAGTVGTEALKGRVEDLFEQDIGLAQEEGVSAAAGRGKFLYKIGVPSFALAAVAAGLLAINSYDVLGKKESPTIPASVPASAAKKQYSIDFSTHDSLFRTFIEALEAGEEGVWKKAFAPKNERSVSVTKYYQGMKVKDVRFGGGDRMSKAYTVCFESPDGQLRKLTIHVIGLKGLSPNEINYVVPAD